VIEDIKVYQEEMAVSCGNSDVAALFDNPIVRRNVRCPRK